MRARFYAHGLVGYNYSANVAEFEVPQGSGTSALFSAGLWMGGYTNNTQLRQAAMMFEGAGAGDYYPGPLNNNGGTNASVMDQYNHVWSVTRQQIEAHIAYYQCLTDVNCDVSVEYPNGYLIPTEILEWPAINDNSGFNTYLAPFYDFNGDGDYQATDGDAPCILGDKALYFVFNDVGGPHLLSGGLPLRAEVQAMPFAYSGAPYLDQTLFVHYHLVNRGSQTLTRARIGLFSDFDLGCANDDFIGSDPSRNLGYVYNWDEFDEDCNGSTGYGSQPPAFGQVLLKGPLLDANALDDPATNSLSAWNGQGFDDAIVDNERSGLDRFIYFNRENAFCCTDPETAQHYMSYLSGIWKDGTPMTYGGSGYSLDSNAIPCAFMYPGNTDPVGAGTSGQCSLHGPKLSKSPRIVGG
ncbi:MAG: hypothetical protein IPO90_13605 [Flavobacteriales bacterium]|nr:hypothetical protein [Flavobacteriales bacterium]